MKNREVIPNDPIEDFGGHKAENTHANTVNKPEEENTAQASSSAKLNLKQVN